MAQIIELLVDSVSVVQPEENLQIVTLTLSYRGQVDLQNQIVEDEELSIEIPSHAPPPQEKSGKKEK